MKPFLIIIIGGLIGFFIHYTKTHYGADISVFSITPHAIEGTLYTLIGAGAGWMLSRRGAA